MSYGINNYYNPNLPPQTPYVDEVPEYITSIKKDVVEKYMEKSSKVKYMHEMYSK